MIDKNKKKHKPSCEHLHVQPSAQRCPQWTEICAQCACGQNNGIRRRRGTATGIAQAHDAQIQIRGPQARQAKPRSPFPAVKASNQRHQHPPRGPGKQKAGGATPQRSQKIFSPKPNTAPRTIEGRPPPCPRPRRHPHNEPLHSNETPSGKVTPKTTHAPQTTKTNTFSSPKRVFSRSPARGSAFSFARYHPPPRLLSTTKHLNGVGTAERFSYQNSDTYRAQEKSFRMERLCHKLRNWS